MPGHILHETESVVIIATTDSRNAKTGNMVQVWILVRSENPVAAVKNGTDSLICGDCPHRGGSCYVQVARAPLAIWHAYQRGAYSYLPISEYGVFAGRFIRLGAYGDPAVIPPEIVAALVAVSAGHTGYTHQWRKSAWLRQYVMASVDSVAEALEARSAGWRTFRVSTGVDPVKGEILCPASAEAGHRVQCADCLLCNGAGPVKNIMIPVHGTGASKFNIL